MESLYLRRGVLSASQSCLGIVRIARRNASRIVPRMGPQVVTVEWQHKGLVLATRMIAHPQAINDGLLHKAGIDNLQQNTLGGKLREF